MYKDGVTPAQSRGARGLLQWTVREAARLTGLSRNAVMRFERGDNVQLSTVRALQTAYEGAGVEFQGKTGVRLSSEEQ